MALSDLQLKNAIAEHGAYRVVAACDRQMSGQPGALAALGMPAPANLGDVVRIMWAAQSELTAMQASRLAARDRIALDLSRSAAKCGAASPHVPPDLAL